MTHPYSGGERPHPMYAPSPGPYPLAQPYPAAPPLPQAYAPPHSYIYPTPMYAPGGVDPFTGEPLSDKSKVAAGMLQLFLGGFGIGRFYLGHIGIAVGQLMTLIVGWILTITVYGAILGLPILLCLGLWTFIDAIMIFTGSVRDSYGRKLRS